MFEGWYSVAEEVLSRHGEIRRFWEELKEKLVF